MGDPVMGDRVKGDHVIGDAKRIRKVRCRGGIRSVLPVKGDPAISDLRKGAAIKISYVY